MYICVSKLTITGSDNGLSPDRRQAIIWNQCWNIIIESLGIDFNEILGEMHTFTFMKMYSKMSSAKWRNFVSASINTMFYALVVGTNGLVNYIVKI